MNPTQTSNQETTRLQPLRQKPSVIVSVALLIVIGIGLGRIVSTYHVFNHTIDEGAHLACGIQWFQGSYTYDRKHTPIARISIAVLPYLNGLRGFGNESFWEEGSLILSSGGRYWHNLILARVGVLPYFVLAVVVVFLWTRRLYGDATGLIAAAIFSMLPVVLAHSGLATTDIPLTACYIIAVYAFTRWLEEPNRRTTVLFGIATGVALATKLSTLAFLPATILGILPLYFLTTRVTAAGGDEKRWGLGSVRSVARAIAIVIVCAFLVIWTTYKYSHAPITVISGEPDKIAAKVFGRSSSMAKGIRVLDAKLQLPAPELIEGVRELRDINNTHPRSYLFGRIRSGGWWYFYPVAIAVKTPLAALLLAVLGAFSLGMGWLRTRTDWQKTVPIIGFLVPIVIAMPTSLDIGVRHVMPVFAFLSILAAVGAVKLWNGRGRTPSWSGRVAVVILALWFVVSSARAHPDYLSYFNELGGKHPENILVISDLDWGQDYARLSTYLREQQIKHITIATANVFDPVALGFPETEHVPCGATPSGWVAVEMRTVRVYPECYPWIGQQKLITTVGKTELIYYMPESPGAKSGAGTSAQNGAVLDPTLPH
jgi:Dolichyl-phosphate-mannose-protein mannosyltransferase